MDSAEPKPKEMPTLLSPFVSKAIEAMDQNHPKWKENLTERQGETLCIPDCLDMSGERYYLSPNIDNSMPKKIDREARITGDNGEDEFLRAFRQLNIGGILLGGFDSKEFFEKLKRMKLSVSYKGPLQKPDFVFFHALIGIMVFEVKGADRNQEFPAKSFNTAIKQVKDRLKWMPDIFKLLTNVVYKAMGNFHFAICYPFFNFNNDPQLELVPNFCHFISKSNVACLETEMATVILPLFRKENVSDSLMQFYDLTASLIYGSKSVVELSHAINALSLYQKLVGQDYEGDRKWTTHTNEERQKARAEFVDDYNEKTTFFLNKDQLEALEWHSMHDATKVQIITGLPGTGKTLILMLQALRASKKAGSGNVVVMAAGDLPLRRKLELFFHKNENEHTKRNVVVAGDQSVFPQDDVYVDEYTITSSRFYKFIQKRLTFGVGQTTFVITGSVEPTSIVNVKDSLAHCGLENYDFCDLRKIVRGTKSIIDKWSQQFPDYFEKQIGHKITGTPVTKIECRTVSECLSVVYDQVQRFVPFDDSKSESLHLPWKPQHLVIITDNTSTSSLVMEYLSDNGIQCGSCEEQMNNPCLIAVSAAPHCMSLEWPVVIAASFKVLFEETYLLIAQSRAVVKLITVKLDFFSLIRPVDDQYSNLFNANMTILDVRDCAQKIFATEISEQISEHYSDAFTPELRGKVMEQENILILLEACVAILRHNYLCKEIRDMPFFETSTSLIDFFSKLADKPVLCIYILERFSTSNKNFFGVTRSKKEPKVFQYVASPRILNHIWADLKEPEILQRWQLLYNLYLRLLDAWNCIMFFQWVNTLAKSQFIHDMRYILNSICEHIDFPLKNLTENNWKEYLTNIRSCDCDWKANTQLKIFTSIWSLFLVSYIGCMKCHEILMLPTFMTTI